MITVVSGLPRSGTSMMMQMLAAGGLPILTDGIRPPDANNPHGYLEFEKVKSLPRDQSWLGAAEGKAVKIISPFLIYLPNNFDYKIIFMDRHIDAVLKSQADMLTNLHPNAPGPNPNLLMPVLKQQREKVRNWVVQQPNMELLLVQYRRVLADPRGESRRLIKFLGLELSRIERLASVVDAT